MRIRLTVRREGVPPAKIWWDVSSVIASQPNARVSTLLKDINLVCPLEVGSIGLEDYVLEIGGYELLHFQRLTDVLRENDEVVVRPLDGAEIKDRRRNGRRQILEDGRKLFDGTLFDRPFVRALEDRPSLDLPPAKRLRLEEGGYATNGNDPDLEDEDEDDGSWVQEDDSTDTSCRDSSEEHGDDEDSDESDESDGEMDQKLITSGCQKIDNSTDEEDEEEHEEPPKELGRPSPLNPDKFWSGKVDWEAIGDAVAAEEQDDEDESDDEDFNLDQSSSEAEESESESESEVEVVSASESSDESDDESSSSSESDSDMDSDSSSESSSSSSSSSSDSSSDSSSSDSSSESSESSSEEKIETRANKATRNASKRPLPDSESSEEEEDEDDEGVSLLQEKTSNKRSGALPPSPSMAPPFQGKRSTRRRNARKRQKRAAAREARQQLQQQSEQPEPSQELSSQVPPSDITDSQTELEKQRQPSFPSSAIDSQELRPTSPLLESIKMDKPSRASFIAKHKGMAKNKRKGFLRDMHGKDPKHIRFDEDTIMGDESTANTDELQARKAHILNDSDAWKSVMPVTAVDCEEGNPDIPVPPFPFQYSGALSKQQHKRKRSTNSQGRAPMEKRQEFEKEDTGPDFTTTDFYDDSTSAQVVVEEAVEVATETMEKAVEDDFPPLPEDVTSLPPLTEEALDSAGTIIVFKHFTMENYMPVLSDFKTAKIADSYVSGGSLCAWLQLAKRDWPKKKVDPMTGEVLRGQFELQDENSENEGFLELEFSEILEGRVLVRPEGLEKAQEKPVEDAVTSTAGKTADVVVTDAPDVEHEKEASPEKEVEVVEEAPSKLVPALTSQVSAISEPDIQVSVFAPGNSRRPSVQATSSSDKENEEDEDDDSEDDEDYQVSSSEEESSEDDEDESEDEEDGEQDVTVTADEGTEQPASTSEEAREEPSTSDTDPTLSNQEASKGDAQDDVEMVDEEEVSEKDQGVDTSAPSDMPEHQPSSEEFSVHVEPEKEASPEPARQVNEEKTHGDVQVARSSPPRSPHPTRPAHQSLEPIDDEEEDDDIADTSFDSNAVARQLVAETHEEETLERILPHEPESNADPEPDFIPFENSPEKGDDSMEDSHQLSHKETQDNSYSSVSIVQETQTSGTLEVETPKQNAATSSMGAVPVLPPTETVDVNKTEIAEKQDIEEKKGELMDSADGSESAVSRNVTPEPEEEEYEEIEEDPERPMTPPPQFHFIDILSPPKRRVKRRRAQTSAGNNLQSPTCNRSGTSTSSRPQSSTSSVQPNSRSHSSESSADERPQISSKVRPEIPIGNPTCLSGLNFVLTGSQPHLDRQEVIQLIKKHGGNVTDFPTKQTSYVIFGENAGPRKTKWIESEGIPKLDEDGLFALIREKTAEIEVKGKEANAEERGRAEQEDIAKELDDEMTPRQVDEVIEEARREALTQQKEMSEEKRDEVAEEAQEVEQEKEDEAPAEIEEAQPVTEAMEVEEPAVEKQQNPAEEQPEQEVDKPLSEEPDHEPEPQPVVTAEKMEETSIQEEPVQEQKMDIDVQKDDTEKMEVDSHEPADPNEMEVDAPEESVQEKPQDVLMEPPMEKAAFQAPSLVRGIQNVLSEVAGKGGLFGKFFFDGAGNKQVAVEPKDLPPSPAEAPAPAPKPTTATNPAPKAKKPEPRRTSKLIVADLGGDSDSDSDSSSDSKDGSDSDEEDFPSLQSIFSQSSQRTVKKEPAQKPTAAPPKSLGGLPKFDSSSKPKSRQSLPTSSQRAPILPPSSSQKSDRRASGSSLSRPRQTLAPLPMPPSNSQSNRSLSRTSESKSSKSTSGFDALASIPSSAPPATGRMSSSQQQQQPRRKPVPAQAAVVDLTLDSDNDTPPTPKPVVKKSGGGGSAVGGTKQWRVERKR